MSEVYIKLIFAGLISWGILRLTIKIIPNVYSIRFVSGYYSFQFIVLLIYIYNDKEAQIWTANYGHLLLSDYIDRGIIAYLTFQTSVLVSAFVGNYLFPMKNKINLIDQIKSNHRSLKTPLLFTAFVILGYPFLSYVPGIGYANSILFNFLLFIPFVAGILFFSSPTLRLVWLIALTILFITGIMTGGRGTAMTSAAIYAIGFYFSLQTSRAKRIALVSGIIVSVPLMALMSFVGIFRSVVGRVDFSKITLERAVYIYETYEKLKDSKIVNLNTQEARLHGWGRFINFVNFAQFATIPEKKDYLGATDLINVDLKYSFDVAFISGTTTEDRINARFANFRLNNYGYWVTDTSSVEYSIVTEAYIRFGHIGIFIFSSLFSLFIVFLEFFVRVIAAKSPPVQIFSIVLLCQQALLGYAYNTFVIMRNMMISIFISFLVIYVLIFIKILFKKDL